MNIYSKHLPDIASKLAGHLALVAALCLVTVVCQASGEMELSESEWRILPEFCRHHDWVSANYPRLGDAAEFEASFGATWLHMHHYCWAQIDYLRSLQSFRPVQERRELIANAVSDLDYVLTKMTVDFPLAAEMYTLRGKAKLQQGDVKGAEKSFLSAIKADPQYWRAYLHWASYLDMLGRKDLALKVAEDGLAHVPESKALKSLVHDIGQGKKAVNKE